MADNDTPELDRDVLFKLVMALDDAWHGFSESIKDIEITIASAYILATFFKKFRELKRYAGILKK